MARWLCWRRPRILAGAALVVWGGAVGRSGTSWDLGFKPLWFLVAANGYSTPLSAAILGLMALIALKLRRCGGLIAEQAGGWLAACFALLYLAMPQMLFDTAYVDVRVLVAAALILPGFVSLRFPDPVFARRAFFAVVALICLNFAFVAALWTSYRADYAAMIESFRQIDIGAKILVARKNAKSPFSGQTLEPMVHAPTLAAVYDKALVSSVMALKGKQPLASRPGFERLNIGDAGSVTMADLAGIAERRSGLFAGWPRDFDFLYVIGAPGENPMPALLAPLRVERRFTLYRIKPV